MFGTNSSEAVNKYCVLEYERTEGGQYPSVYYRVKFFPTEEKARNAAGKARNGKTQYVACILCVAEAETRMIFTEMLNGDKKE